MIFVLWLWAVLFAQVGDVNQLYDGFDLNTSTWRTVLNYSSSGGFLDDVLITREAAWDETGQPSNCTGSGDVDCIDYAAHDLHVRVTLDGGTAKTWDDSGDIGDLSAGNIGGISRDGAGTRARVRKIRLGGARFDTSFLVEVQHSEGNQRNVYTVVYYRTDQ
jgi:hypothetical protein